MHGRHEADTNPGRSGFYAILRLLDPEKMAWKLLLAGQWLLSPPQGLRELEGSLVPEGIMIGRGGGRFLNCRGPRERPKPEAMANV